MCRYESKKGPSEDEKETKRETKKRLIIHMACLDSDRLIDMLRALQE